MKILVEQQRFHSFFPSDEQEHENDFEENRSDLDQGKTSFDVQFIILPSKPCSVIIGSTNSSSPITALHSVLVPPKMSLKNAHVSFDPSYSRYSSVAKRISSNSNGSLSHPHSTLIITGIVNNLSEDMSHSIDYENTYLYPEETSRIDDIFSLTTITSNIIRDIQPNQYNTSLHSDNQLIQSDTDDTSEAITSAVQPYGDLSIVLQ